VLGEPFYLLEAKSGKFKSCPYQPYWIITDRTSVQSSCGQNHGSKGCHAIQTACRYHLRAAIKGAARDARLFDPVIFSGVIYGPAKGSIVVA